MAENPGDFIQCTTESSGPCYIRKLDIVAIYGYQEKRTYIALRNHGSGSQSPFPQGFIVKESPADVFDLMTGPT